MAKLTRYLQKIFANNSNQVGVFGTGTDKETSKNVETLQSTDYENGWSSAIITNKNYPIWQERDGVDYGFSYQLAYLMQSGIPEWLSTETYYTNSYCRIGSDLYYSLQDNNINHNPTTETTWWYKFTPANTDLSNITTTAENTIMNLSLVDWPNRVYQTSSGNVDITYTCPSKGWINYTTLCTGNGNIASVTVNNWLVNETVGKGNTAIQALTGGFPVDSGDVVMLHPQYTSSSNYLYFFPLKGV